MQVAVIYGIPIAGNDVDCDVYQISDRLQELNDKYKRNDLYKNILRYGGSNNDGAIYIGIILEELCDGYESTFVELSKLFITTANNSSAIEKFKDWWFKSEIANDLRSVLKLEESQRFEVYLVMDSD